jgi:eukaryotic-like serine/threonine-protein kinase
MDKKNIEFLRSKDYKFLEEIGQGGTGKTVLLHDEIIDEKFVCKKYSTFFKEHQEIYYQNFIDEIKLLHLLYHKNVVRVFNYYLYPENTTGYILMEYIQGKTIDTFVQENPDKIDDIFTQTIAGFMHLEQNEILHRDIRPENILVSHEIVLKIIDLGFGKKIDFEEDFDNSISLNWRYTKPKDFEDKIYNYTTEVYFVGKLFEEIIVQNKIQNFTFTSVLNEMIKFDLHERTKSFFEVDRNIIAGEATAIEFSDEEVSRYRNFADAICSFITKIETGAKYQNNIDQIVSELDKIYMNSMLEEFVQSLNLVSRELVKSGYYFDRNFKISVTDLKNFIHLIKSVPIGKRRVIFNNLWTRLDTIDRYEDEIDSDPLPF